jgi:hypothetical protein
VGVTGDDKRRASSSSSFSSAAGEEAAAAQMGAGSGGDFASGTTAVAWEDANDTTTDGVHPPNAKGDGNDKCRSMATLDDDGSSTA